MTEITELPETFEVDRAWGDGTERQMENYDRNESAANRAGLTACVICGRGVQPGNGSELWMIFGGPSAVRKDLDAEAVEGYEPGGDMGAWTIGPECQKKVPAAYRRPRA